MVKNLFKFGSQRSINIGKRNSAGLELLYWGICPVPIQEPRNIGLQMNIDNKEVQPYGDLVASDLDYVPSCDGYIVGVAFDDSGMHLTTVDFEPEASHQCIDWSRVHADGVTKISREHRDYLLRCADEIVIDSDCTGLSPRQLRQQQRMIQELVALSTKVSTRVRHGAAPVDTRKLNGKQRSVAAARFGFDEKLQSMRDLFERSCRGLLTDETRDEQFVPSN